MQILVIATKENTRLDAHLANYDWQRVASCHEANALLKHQAFGLVFVDMACDTHTIHASNVCNLSTLNGQMFAEVVTQKLFTYTLQQATQLVNKSLELEHQLDAFMVLLARLIPCDMLTILLIENDLAYVVKFYGNDQPDLHFNLHQNPDLQAIVTTEKPLWTPDTSQVDGWLRPDVRSAIGVPLKVHNTTIGILQLESYIASHFEPHNVEWAAAFADLISISIYNSRLFYENQRNEQELDALRQTSEITSSLLKLDQLIEIILTHLKKAVHYDNVAICLMDVEQFEIVAVQGFDEPQNYISRRFDPRQHVLFRELMKRKTSVTSINAQTDSRFDDWSTLEYKRSWLTVPLNAHSSIIGCVIMSSEKIGVYDQPEITLVESFANQISLAVYNAQLFEEIRRHAIELEDRVDQRTSELRDANEEIKRSETRYRVLFEASFEAICVHDKGIILDVNPAFEAMFEYSWNELIGTNVLDLTAPESKNEVLHRIQTGNESTYEANVTRKNGQVFPVELIGKEYIYQGQPVRITALRELTQRQKLEQQRLELAIERQKTKILSDFLAQASHEFRTPLTLIKTQSYLLTKSLEAERQLERVDVIEKQADHITTLINNMVTLSKLDSGTDLLEFEPIDLNKLIEHNLQETASVMQENQLELLTNYSHTSLAIIGDSMYLGIAFKHIIDNAIQHTALGDKITIHCDKDEDYAVVKIEDTGFGMSSKVLPHIFERFYRADTSGTYRGFGLGLSITQQIIEGHNGIIDVESVENQGSKFTIKLPLQR